MDNSADLKVLLGSRHALVLAETDEEDRFMHILRGAAEELGMSVWTWSVTQGLARDGRPAMYQTVEPTKALAFVGDSEGPGVYVFADAHPFLDDPVVLRKLKEVAAAAPDYRTVIVTAPNHDVPPELADLAHVWALHPPNTEELRDLLARTLRDLDDRGFRVAIDTEHFADILGTLAGLSVREAERLIQRAALDDGAVTPEDIPRLRTAKAELLAEDGILELVEADVGTFADVGGFDQLKEWFQVRALARAAGADELGLEPPRGVLLTGVPGCGKSLIAKTLARTWGLPLVLLDPARLYSKYLGESEQRLTRALDAIDAMAPVVMWIDEIEKGFAVGGEGDSGVSRRLLGTFLRWMQDRRSDVFMVATANDVRALPPELLRKGRFDEIFFVDLPDIEARLEIFRSHLERRNQDPADFDVTSLAGLTAGFSGAEIETVIVGALYRSLAEGSELSDLQLRRELQSTVPLSVTRAEDVAVLRNWASERAVAA